MNYAIHKIAVLCFGISLLVISNNGLSVESPSESDVLFLRVAAIRGDKAAEAKLISLSEAGNTGAMVHLAHVYDRRSRPADTVIDKQAALEQAKLNNVLANLGDCSGQHATGFNYTDDAVRPSNLVLGLMWRLVAFRHCAAGKKGGESIPDYSWSFLLTLSKPGAIAGWDNKIAERDRLELQEILESAKADGTTTMQISEAQKMAAECEKRGYKNCDSTGTKYVRRSKR